MARPPPPSINVGLSPVRRNHGESDSSTPTTPSFKSSAYLSPTTALHPIIHEEESQEGNTSSIPNPFNFQPVSYSPALIGPAPHSAKGDLGRRRGHKYARSSVSHEIILSPAPRTPLQLPVSLPMPTFKEYRASMSKEQKHRWLWCFCHLSVAAYVQMQAHESLSVTALSHLMFYDALGAFLCVGVDVFRNFEVWTRSTISHAFGLERLEVLAGLAMSITLLFMGLDLLSHGLSHAMESSSGHQPHHHGGHSHHGLDSVNFAAILAVLSTFISASILGNHSRIGRAIRIPMFESLPAAVRNPSHFLPISLSILVFVLPRLGIHMSGRVDALLGFAYACGMVVLGARLCYGVGRMLLMSYSGPGVKTVVQEINKETAVTGVDEAKVWQVHYGLCIANFKIRVNNAEYIERLRDRISSLVKNRLGGGYGEGSRGVKWEISTQITIDR